MKEESGDEKWMRWNGLKVKLMKNEKPILYVISTLLIHHQTTKINNVMKRKVKNELRKWWEKGMMKRVEDEIIENEKEKLILCVIFTLLIHHQREKMKNGMKRKLKNEWLRKWWETMMKRVENEIVERWKRKPILCLISTLLIHYQERKWRKEMDDTNLI